MNHGESDANGRTSRQAVRPSGSNHHSRCYRSKGSSGFLGVRVKMAHYGETGNYLARVVWFLKVLPSGEVLQWSAGVEPKPLEGSRSRWQDLSAIWPDGSRSTKLYKAPADPECCSCTLPKRKERGQLTGQLTAFNRISKNGR